MGSSRRSPVTYVIGRSATADIVLSDSTVSRLHAELTRSGDGAWYLTDRCSSGGTYRMGAEGWIPIRQGFVHHGDRLRLGAFECALDDLVRQIPAALGTAPESADDGTGGPAVHDDRPDGEVYRNELGEVVSKEDG